MSRKNAFIANQKNFISRKFYELHSKPFFTHKNFFLHVPFLAGFKNRPFSQTKRFSFAQTFFTATQSSLFCPPPPLPTALNLLFAKNTVVLLLFALILCCKARTSHRFKSSPSIPGNLAIPGTAGYMMNAGRFRNNYISTGDLNRGRRTESTP